MAEICWHFWRNQFVFRIKLFNKFVCLTIISSYFFMGVDSEGLISPIFAYGVSFTYSAGAGFCRGGVTIFDDFIFFFSSSTLIFVFKPPRTGPGYMSQCHSLSTDTDNIFLAHLDDWALIVPLTIDTTNVQYTCMLLLLNVLKLRNYWELTKRWIAVMDAIGNIIFPVRLYRRPLFSAVSSPDKSVSRISLIWQR